MKNLLYILSLALVFASCEKVIDVDLNEANPQLVIEARLYHGAEEFEVQISKTSSYFDAEEIQKIDDATVVLIGPENEQTELSSAGDGKYSVQLPAVAEGNYRLEVSHSLGFYTASTYVHASPEVGQASAEETSFRPPFGLNEEEGSGPLYFVSTRIKDQPGTSNYYRFNLTVNGVLENSLRGGYYLLEDENQDGEWIDYTLVGAFLNEGDQVEIETWSIDEATYRFYETMGNSEGEGMASAAPANPQNNWSNGALGYFAGISAAQQQLTLTP